MTDICDNTITPFQPSQLHSKLHCQYNDTIRLKVQNNTLKLYQSTSHFYCMVFPKNIHIMRGNFPYKGKYHIFDLGTSHAHLLRKLMCIKNINFKFLLFFYEHTHSVCYHNWFNLLRIYNQLQ